MAIILSLCAGCATQGDTLTSADARQKYVFTEAPDALKVCPPKYPRDALMRGIEGSVELAFSIDRQGVPKEIEVLNSSPKGVFDLSAKRALECWRYPEGTEVERTSVTLDFKLGG